MDNERLPRPVIVPRDSAGSPAGDATDRAAFGEFLQRSRQARGISLQQVGAETKVAARFLAALERGEMDVLPQGFYRRAMLRAYASAVGLDPDIVYNRYLQTFERADNQSKPADVPAVSTPPSDRWLMGSVAVIVVALGVSAGVIYESFWRGALAQPVLVPELPALPVPEAPRPPLNSVAVPQPPPNDAGTPQPEATTAQEATPQQDANDGTEATSGNPAEPVEETAIASDLSLTVTSSPSGAFVTVNGIGYGITPLTIRRVSPGRKVVRLTRDGFEGQEQSVTVDASAGPASLSVTLPPRN